MGGETKEDSDAGHDLGSRKKDEKVSSAVPKKRMGHGGNLVGGCRRRQVGRPDLRSSASEV